MRNAETLWEQFGKKRMTFAQKIDFYRQLSSQFPIARTRVIFAASGTNPAAAILRDDKAIIDYGLYWMKTGDELEALFLAGILNSETARAKAERWQSRGQWGARHFDEVIFNLPIRSSIRT